MEWSKDAEGKGEKLQSNGLLQNTKRRDSWESFIVLPIVLRFGLWRFPFCSTQCCTICKLVWERAGALGVVHPLCLPGNLIFRKNISNQTPGPFLSEFLLLFLIFKVYLLLLLLLAILLLGMCVLVCVGIHMLWIVCKDQRMTFRIQLLIYFGLQRSNSSPRAYVPSVCTH